MKILVIAPFNIPIPPLDGYGGTQRVVYDVVTRLAVSDSVHLFAPDGSQNIADVRLLPYVSNQAEDCMAQVLAHIQHQSYDMVYSHLSSSEFAEAILKHTKKLVVASHYYFALDLLQKFEALDCWLQAQSHSHAAYTSQYVSKVIAVKQSVAIDHIIPSLVTLKKAPEQDITLPVLRSLRQKDQDYLLIISRISNYKGQATAIRLSKATGIPLIIAGEPVSRSEGDHDYFAKSIKPQIDGEQIIYFGNANEAEKIELLRFAKASILPTGFENNDWHEAFGRVVNESLACGTPVVAHDWDAMPEQIVHGENGFLFRTFDEAVDAIQRIDEINRARCIETTQTDLNADRFVADLRAAFTPLLDTEQS